MSEFVAVTDVAVAKMMDAANKEKLKRIAARAASFMSTAISLEHQTRRAAVMRRAKDNFTGNMTKPMAGISIPVGNAMSSFFESVVDYDPDTAMDAKAMGEIWDTMANMPAVADVVNFNKTEEGKRAMEEEKTQKQEEKTQKGVDKQKKEEDKQKKEAGELREKYQRILKRLKENREILGKLNTQIKKKQDKITDDETAKKSMEDKFVELMVEIPEQEEEGTPKGTSNGSSGASMPRSEDSPKDGSGESAGS